MSVRGAMALPSTSRMMESCMPACLSLPTSSRGCGRRPGILQGEGIADGKSNAVCINASPKFQDSNPEGYKNPYLGLPSWIAQGNFEGADPEIRIRKSVFITHYRTMRPQITEPVAEALQARLGYMMET